MNDVVYKQKVFLARVCEYPPMSEEDRENSIENSMDALTLFTNCMREIKKGDEYYSDVRSAVISSMLQLIDIWLAQPNETWYSLEQLLLKRISDNTTLIERASKL